MFKKKQEEKIEDQAPVAPVSVAPAAPVSGAPKFERSKGSDQVTLIGPGIVFRGEVAGEEDLLIQGRVEGTVDLRQSTLTIGPNGKVEADITGRVVVIQGRVTGNVTGYEKVVLRGTAVVDGDVFSPQLTIEEGARFSGAIDMGEKAEAKLKAVANGHSSNGHSSNGLAAQRKMDEVKQPAIKAAT